MEARVYIVTFYNYKVDAQEVAKFDTFRELNEFLSLIERNEDYVLIKVDSKEPYYDGTELLKELRSEWYSRDSHLEIGEL